MFSASLLSQIGAAATAYLTVKSALKIWSFLKLYIIPRYAAIGIDVKKLGDWAVVTGSTDGIGKGYALELARKGMNIVLLSRSAQKLKATANDIESRYRVQTKSIQVDFADEDAIYREVAFIMRGLNIGVLVNNVGVGYDFPQFFMDIDNMDETIARQMRVNAWSAVKMTQIVLPEMVRKGRGAIVNISSMTGLRAATPLLTMYSAAKAFVVYFSSGLQKEYKDKGITVQCIVPYLVATNMSRAKPNIFAPTPGAFARSAVATIGLTDIAYGCLSHSLQAWCLSLLPDWLYQRLMHAATLRMRKQALIARQR